MHYALAEIPVFQSLPEEVLRQLGECCEFVCFKKGEAIFKEGEEALSVWVIKRGMVYLVKRTPEGNTATFFTMTPEEAICGVSAIEHMRYSAGAVAATDVELIRVPAEECSRLLRGHSRFAELMLLSSCRRIRQMDEAMNISHATVEQRLAHVLLRLRSNFGNSISMTHQELSRMAGMRWETSIRILSAMKRRGWMSSSRGKVTILAPEKLQAVVRRANGCAGGLSR